MESSQTLIKHLTNLIFALERDNLSDAYRAKTCERLAKLIEHLEQS